MQIEGDKKVFFIRILVISCFIVDKTRVHHLLRIANATSGGACKAACDNLTVWLIVKLVKILFPIHINHLGKPKTKCPCGLELGCETQTLPPIGQQKVKPKTISGR